MAMMAIFSSVRYTCALPFGLVLKFLITQGYSDMTKKTNTAFTLPSVSSLSRRHADNQVGRLEALDEAAEVLPFV